MTIQRKTLDIDIPADAPNAVLAEHMLVVADLAGDIAHNLLVQMEGVGSVDGIAVHSGYLRVRTQTLTLIDHLRANSFTPERLGKMAERDYRRSMADLMILLRQHLSGIQMAANHYQTMKHELVSDTGNIAQPWQMHFRTAMNQARQTAATIGRYRAWWRNQRTDRVDAGFVGNM